MDKNAIKKYAVWARRELISRVSQKAVQYGITEESFGDPDADSVDGRVLTKAEKQQRQTLIRRIKEAGYRQVMEEAAYTWFNRFIALRFMEVNGYLPSHVRVFTDDQGSFKPQILTEAINLDLDGLDMERVYALKDANKTEELYKYLLIVQCNALNPILPGMFQKIEDYTELLFPDNLLREGSVIDRMVRQGESDSIPESDWTDQVQIIGWLYQYYNTEPKDQVFADLKKNIKITKEKIPAATQLFTPDWIVRYMVENSLGRLWVEGHPSAKEKFLPVHNEDGSVRKEDGRWNYYLEEAEQEPEVEVQLAEIRREYAALTPEEIRVIDPCCGSGHILCYLFDVLEQIYEDYGYTAREAAQKIVQHNLHGLDIDPRAVQLSYFAVMMKARQYDRRFFSRNIQPMVYSPEGYPEGMEYGSLITVDELEPAPDFDNWTLHDGDYLTSLNRWSFRYVLHQKYHVVVTNPPYMGSRNYSDKIAKFLQTYYPDNRQDLFAAFIQRCIVFSVDGFLMSMITMHTFMFLASFDKMRSNFLTNSIVSLLHLGIKAFDEIGNDVVQTTSFVSRKVLLPQFRSTFCRLVDCKDQVLKETEFLSRHNFFSSRTSDFLRIPGSPVAYWVSENFIHNFEEYTSLDTYITVSALNKTGDNDRFLRNWWEVDSSNIGHKWRFYSKGGNFRRYYGNLEDVIDWSDTARLFYKTNKTSNLINEEYWFREGITYSAVTSRGTGFRYLPNGCLYDMGGPAIFVSGNHLFLVLALLNSSVASHYFNVLNPSINLQTKDIKSLPVIMDKADEVESLSKRCMEIAKWDWDRRETSYNFASRSINGRRIKDDHQVGLNEAQIAYQKFNAYLLEINELFAHEYGLLVNELPQVEERDISVSIPSVLSWVKDFISFSIGCMFGRYSLDMPGLAFAGGSFSDRFINAGNPLTDESGNLLVDENGDYLSDGENCYSVIRIDGKEKLTTFAPDYDNILPICDDDYFEDDIVSRFVEFVETVYGKETLEENLKFIADALGGKGSPREVIRNYFLNDFYADHLKVYQKRPIYWLFDSGKKNGFKCLIYMHRYQPDTIARIRTDYVHELQGRYRTAIADLERRMTNVSTAERVRLSKQLAKLQDQAEELRAYEEKIHHLADQMISIDLDDGVKVNYAKFQDVLAKIK